MHFHVLFVYAYVEISCFQAIPMVSVDWSIIVMDMCVACWSELSRVLFSEVMKLTKIHLTGLYQQQ